MIRRVPVSSLRSFLHSSGLGAEILGVIENRHLKIGDGMGESIRGGGEVVCGLVVLLVVDGGEVVLDLVIGGKVEVYEFVVSGRVGVFSF